ncbi:hypothetical protein Btru_070530 [Bulinus truncatus]|nr:hypothetical protein Btru_070530 [Bulinus truncatus]
MEEAALQPKAMLTLLKWEGVSAQVRRRLILHLYRRLPQNLSLNLSSSREEVIVLEDDRAVQIAELEVEDIDGWKVCLAQNSDSDSDEKSDKEDVT